MFCCPAESAMSKVRKDQIFEESTSMILGSMTLVRGCFHCAETETERFKGLFHA